MLTSLMSLLLAFVYRLRGGGYVTLGSDVYTRLIWGGAMTLTFGIQDGLHLWTLLAVFISSYLCMLIPHAYAQNMGTWPTPQKGWPSFFFPSWTAAGWTAAPKWQRALYDAGQMACVAFFSALIVFGSVATVSIPDIGLGALPPLFTGIAALMVFQPVGYLLGVYAMFFSIPGCTKFSAEWGEFLTGAAWGVAVGLSVLS